MWKLIVEWWENNKQVLLKKVFPALDGAVIPLTNFLIDRGIPMDTAKALAKDLVEWVKIYLARQI